MKTITDIKEQAKNKKRVNVYLDGVYYCGLDLVTAVKYRLKKGMQIKESDIVEMQRTSEMQACFDSALNYLSLSIKTTKQVRDNLLKKGYLSEVVDETVLKLNEYGYLNDLEYAKRYVESYKNSKGKRLIELELIKKGVKKECVYDALNLIEEQTESIEKLAEKYLKNKNKDLKTLQKLFKYLISKGFGYDEVQLAISSIKTDGKTEFCE